MGHGLSDYVGLKIVADSGGGEGWVGQIQSKMQRDMACGEVDWLLVSH